MLEVVILAPIDTEYCKTRIACAQSVCDKNSLGTVWKQFGDSFGTVGNSLGEFKTKASYCIQMGFKWENDI